MSEENLTGSLPPAGDGAAAFNDSVGLSELLGKELGKQFPDDQSALKAVKDTFSHVGEVGKYKSAVENAANKRGMSVDAFMQTLSTEDARTVDTSRFVSREEFDETTFFAGNAELGEHRQLLKNLAKAEGKSLAEVAGSEQFKRLYDLAKAHQEAEKTKSVLSSNPRLGIVTDKLKEASVDLQEFHKTGSKDAYNSAKSKAVSAVLDSLS